MPITTRHELLQDFRASSKDISFFAGQSRHKGWLIQNLLEPHYSILCTSFLQSKDPEEQLDLLNDIVTMAEIQAVIHKGLGVNDETARYNQEVATSSQLLVILQQRYHPHSHMQDENVQNDDDRAPEDADNSFAYPDENHEEEDEEIEGEPHEASEQKQNAENQVLLPQGIPASQNDADAEVNPRKALRRAYDKYQAFWQAVHKFLVDYWNNFKKMARGVFRDVKIFRQVAFFWNWLRLCLVRIKKLLNTMLPFLEQFPSYKQFVGHINKYTDNVFPYIGWIFFIPRLSVNLVLILKHTFHHLIPNVIPHDRTEDQLDPWVRFRAQIYRRWPQLANDCPWITAGILGCFVLGTAYPAVEILSVAFPVNTLLTAALYVYDLLMAILNAVIDLKRLNILKQTYVNKTNEVLTAYISYEKKRILWSVSIAAITCVAAIICFILPIVLPGAGIPFAGAFALLCMSFIFRYARDHVIPKPKMTSGIATFFTMEPAPKEARHSIIGASAASSRYSANSNNPEISANFAMPSLSVHTANPLSPRSTPVGSANRTPTLTPLLIPQNPDNSLLDPDAEFPGGALSPSSQLVSGA